MPTVMDPVARHRVLHVLGIVERKFNPAQIRDPGGEGGGRWVTNPAAGAVGKLVDKLKLGARKRNRTELADGEVLLGSDVFTTAGGAEFLFAATRRSDGTRTVRMATGVEDKTDWGANNRGGTAVLDERGVGRLRNELDRMVEAEKEFKDRYKAAEKQYEKAKTTQYQLMRRKHPDLAAHQWHEIEDLDDDIQGIPNNIDMTNDRIDERAGDLPSELYDDWLQLEAELAKLAPDSPARAALYDRQAELLDELPAQRWGRWPGDAYRSDLRDLAKNQERLDYAVARRRDLLSLSMAELSTADTDALDEAKTARNDAWTELTGDLAEVTLVDGTVSGDWTDVGFLADTDEQGDVSHHVDVRPTDAPDDWYPGYDGSDPLTSADLRKLTTKLAEMITEGGEVERSADFTPSLHPHDPHTGRWMDTPDLMEDDGGGSVRSTATRMIPYDPEKHPHAPAGTSTGGQFTAGGGDSKPAAKQGMGKRRPVKHAAPGKGRERPSKDNPDLFFDPGANTGTGYDQDGGDQRVRKLQEALNRLGLKDAKGKRLRVDGELGPLTTQAVKAAQQKLGLKPDGRVTPALLKQLAEAKSLSASKPRKAIYRFDGVDEDGEFRRVLPATQTRAFDFELRAKPGSDGYDLEGYVAVFGAVARIADHGGDFDEEIHRGTFDRYLARAVPVMQFDHGKDPRTGTVPIGVYRRFAPDSRGYEVNGRLFRNPVVDPVREAIAEGAITGMSWRMMVNPKGGDRWTRRNGEVDKRDVLDADVPEAGPVVFPAYDATTVSVRSILANFSGEERAALVRELAAEVRAAVNLDDLPRTYLDDDVVLPDLTVEPDARGVGDGDYDVRPGSGATSVMTIDQLELRARSLRALYPGVFHG